MPNGLKKLLLIVLVAACGVLSSATAAVVEDAADKPTATVVGSSDAQTVPNSSGGLRRLPPVRCGSSNCNRECSGDPCRKGDVWDPSCCDVLTQNSPDGKCSFFAPEGVCPAVVACGPCPDPNSVCEGDDAAFTCSCPTGACNGGVCEAGSGDYICTSCTPQWTGEKCQDDVDECANGTNDCHVNADCSNESGRFSCSCKAGYLGDGTTVGTGCTNDNECVLETDNCHENAICSDTEGSFTCACQPGYTGDGVTSCVDDDECALGTDNCAATEICINTPGGFDCGIDQCQAQSVCSGDCTNGDQSSFICDCPATNPCDPGFKCEAGINVDYSCVLESTGLCSNDQTECATASECGGTCFLGKDDGKACSIDVNNCADTLRCTSGPNIGFECDSQGTSDPNCSIVEYRCVGGRDGRECSGPGADSECKRGKNTGTCTAIVEQGDCGVYLAGNCRSDITTCDEIDHCNPDPCLNGGTCADIGATFECQCPTGYEGQKCNGADQEYNSRGS